MAVLKSTFLSNKPYLSHMAMPCAEPLKKTSIEMEVLAASPTLPAQASVFKGASTLSSKVTCGWVSADPGNKKLR